MDLLPVVVVVVLVGASVTDPDDASCCRSVPDCTSHLSGHWCQKFLCHSCRSPLCIVWPCVLVAHICSKHLLLVFLLLLFLLVACCTSPSNGFPCPIVDCTCLFILCSCCCCSLCLCLLSFALVLALLSFSFVVPCCSYVHWCRSLIVAA